MTNHYELPKTKKENDMTEFFKLFPKKTNIKKSRWKNLCFVNGKITNIETKDSKIIKWIKEKGLK